MPLNKSSHLKIGMILDGNYPQDIRVRKEAESLAKHHSVYILCCKNNDEKEYEEINGVKVCRWVSYKSNFEKGLVDMALAVNFVHPYFARKTKGFVQEYSIDVLHVHDLPLAKTGYKARSEKTKVILDLHENYAAALATWFAWRKNPIVQLKNKLFFNPKRWAKYEAKYVHKFDKIIAVVDEMKERIVNQNGLAEISVVVVANSEKKEFAEHFQSKKENYFTNFEDKFIISYVGGFGPHRGLHVAIEGMQYVIKEIPNALLVLVGPSNKDVRDYLIGLIHKFGLQDHILIRGREPFEKVVQIMKSSDVNIIPHVSNEHTDSTIPHKLYQILLSGKPLLVSDCPPMKRVVNDYQVGTVFGADDPLSFSEKVIDIHKKPEEAKQKAELGFEKSYHGELNWETTSQELLNLYTRLID